MAEQLGEKERGQQTAIWELITTELAYIRTLKVIQDVSLSFSWPYTALNFKKTIIFPSFNCTLLMISAFKHS
jgi:hypothetical protein